MKRIANFFPAFIGVTLLALFFLQNLSAADSPDVYEEIDCFHTLKQKLIADKFDPGLIETLYSDDFITFDEKGVSLFFKHNEAKLKYRVFTSRDSIQRARRYIRKHKAVLAKIEKKFGVDKTILTAIMLVETGLGTYTGKRPVINTLSSMAALSDPDVKEYLWETLEGERSMTRRDFDRKADEKSRWAYRELKDFIRYVHRENIDPYSLKGSYAGALGIAQFMPSSILAFARDGDNDGSINMFDHTDAMASIAHYLKKHGWHAGIGPKKARKVLYSYNNSSYYVATLMKISKELKGKHG
jgi:membrane-bound lytic murein transglycosylase B